MREPLEKLYGVEYFTQTWNDWIDIMVKIRNNCNGDICRNDLKNIVAPTLILHGKKDPMIAAEHVPYLLENIRDSK